MRYGRAYVRGRRGILEVDVADVVEAVFNQTMPGHAGTADRRPGVALSGPSRP